MTGRLKTGSEKFDGFLEGGYEEGVITTFYGPSGMGKTTACLLSAISASKEGKIIFIDTEGGFSAERVKQLTPAYKDVLERIFLMTPTNFEEQKQCIENLHRNFPKGVNLLVCDTISSLYRIERADDNRGLNSELGRQLGKLLELARTKKIPVVLTNQVYSDFDDKTKVKMVGGDIFTYNSKCLIELHRTSENGRKASLRKHRWLPERETEFEIVHEGIV